ncbi:glycine cleavage system protein GcvH [Chryseobacterium aahli]|uniref:glycine cleavage system protein GcvH n=1 Tax=Chryseobacterium aahli TaxID=1278643 RepID=UPI001F60E3F0|nr:glycine cleavage system protein GcvH [Chryseobacterium aahli]MCI3936320.1 glycine cleavage system protein GcvH [Chryseobacterium aahli]
MKIHENILYTEDHVWIRIEGNTAYVGITDFAQKELGGIIYVKIKTLGKKLKQNEIFGTIEAVKTVYDFIMPIAGEIIEINPKLVSNPHLINSDPYGEGWIAKIKMNNLFDVEWLLRSSSYSVLINL